MAQYRVTRPYRDRETREVVKPGTVIDVSGDYADALIRANVVELVAGAPATETATTAEPVAETASRNRSRSTAARKPAKPRGA